MSSAVHYVECEDPDYPYEVRFGSEPADLTPIRLESPVFATEGEAADAAAQLGRLYEHAETCLRAAAKLTGQAIDMVRDLPLGLPSDHVTRGAQCHEELVQVSACLTRASGMFEA